jgi:DNA-binding NtrC family response regulator
MVKGTITALLVGKLDGCLPKLKQCLEELGVKTAFVDQPNKLRVRLRKPNAPELVFAATEPSDDTWSEVVNVARQTGNQPVIVASRVVDVRKYLDALDRGAFDFVVPPFAQQDLRFVVESAIARKLAYENQ